MPREFYEPRTRPRDDQDGDYPHNGLMHVWEQRGACLGYYRNDQNRRGSMIVIGEPEWT